MRAREFTINIPINIKINGDGEPEIDMGNGSKEGDPEENIPVHVNPYKEERNHGEAAVNFVVEEGFVSVDRVKILGGLARERGGKSAHEGGEPVHALVRKNFVDETEHEDVDQEGADVGAGEVPRKHPPHERHGRKRERHGSGSEHE